MNRVKRIFFTALAVLVLGLGLSARMALAVDFFPPITSFQDDDLDWLINGPTSTGEFTLDQGDRLVGIVKYTETFGELGGGPSAITNPELAGVFDITVVAKIANPDGTFDFVFGPSGATGVLSTRPDGTMVTLWLDDTPDLTINPPNCGSLALCIAAASDGTVFLDAGFNLDPNQFWLADNVASDDISVVAGGSSGTEFGGFNFFLNVLTNGTGQNITPQLCSPFCPAGGDNSIDIIGRGDILGGRGLTNGAFARSDTDFTLQTVPEPSTLLLLGAGLIGLNFITRRRMKK